MNLTNKDKEKQKQFLKMNRILLQTCTFCDKDDLEYIRSDVRWIESRAEKLTYEERTALAKLVFNLHEMNVDMIDESFIMRLMGECFDRHYLKCLAQEKRKHDIKAIFIATVVRELILREETSEAMIEARQNFFNNFPFLAEQEGTNTELTWLNRFARGLKYLTRVLTPAGNKQTYLNVGANLEGSSVFTEYITGGSNRPETQRRVDIYVEVTEVIPKKRTCKTPRKNPPKKLEIPGVKRGRGRPRKNPLSVIPITPSSICTSNYNAMLTPESIYTPYGNRQPSPYTFDDYQEGYVYGKNQQYAHSASSDATSMEFEDSMFEFELLDENDFQEFVDIMGMDD